MKYTLVFPVLCIFLLFISCCTNNQNDSNNNYNIFYFGTSDYKKAVEKFKIKPDVARQKVIDYSRNQKKKKGLPPSSKVFVGDHFVIINNHYLFSKPNKQAISLTGYYVDADTGAVEYRKSKERLPYKWEIPQKNQ